MTAVLDELVDIEYIGFLTKLTRSADVMLREQATAELLKVGPKGYVHGWIYVGPPKVGTRVRDPDLGHGTVTRRGKKTTAVRFDSGATHSWEHADETPTPEIATPRLGKPRAAAKPARTAAPARTTTAAAAKPRGAKPRSEGEARRGDLVVVETTRRDYSSGRGVEERKEFEVARVTSVTREGNVKAYQGVRDDSPTPVVRLPSSYHARFHLMSPGEIDVEAALAAARDNPWPHAPEHKGKLFDSLDEVKAAIAPHRLKPAKAARPAPPTGTRVSELTGSAMLDRQMQDRYPPAKHGDNLPAEHLDVFNQAKTDIDAGTPIEEIAHRFATYAKQLLGNTVDYRARGGAITADMRRNSNSANVYQNIASQLRMGHHKTPKAIDDLMAAAEVQGWVTRATRSEDNGGSPFVTVELANLEQQRGFNLTWHTHGIGTYRLMSAIDRRGRATSLRQIRQDIDRGPVVETPASPEPPASPHPQDRPGAYTSGGGSGYTEPGQPKQTPGLMTPQDTAQFLRYVADHEADDNHLDTAAIRGVAGDVEAGRTTVEAAQAWLTRLAADGEWDHSNMGLARNVALRNAADGLLARTNSADRSLMQIRADARAKRDAATAAEPVGATRTRHIPT